MSLNWYAYGKAQGVLGTIQANGLMQAWFKSTYTPNLATDTTYTSIVATESSGAGYTAGGIQCTSVTVPYTAANALTSIWAAGTTYAQGQFVRPSVGNGFVYYCEAGGVSGGSAPAFATVNGAMFSDGGVVWTCMGQAVVQLLATIPTYSFTSTDFQKAVWYDKTTKVLACVWNSGNTTPITSQPVSIAPDATGLAYDFVG